MELRKNIRKDRKRKVKTFVKYLKKTEVAFKYNKRFDKKKLFFLKKIYNKNLKKKVSNALALKNNFSKKIDIKIVQNNFFCTLVDLDSNKILHNCSSGIYKIKISKRKIKHFFNIFLLVFFSRIKKYCKTLNNIIFNVTAPIRIRKKICKTVKNQIKKFKKRKNNVLINVISKKCFNGCRVKKKLRKKRRLYRIYKK